MTLELFGLKEIPLVKKGDNIAEIIKEDLIKEEIGLKDGDIILIAETLISKAEGNIIELDKVKPTEEAIEIAEKCKKDPKVVQAILDVSREVVRIGPNFIITETKHGFVSANAGLDESNVEDGLATPMPEDPDKSARKIREYLESEMDKEVAVIITDTQGRAFRFGAVGTAIGCSEVATADELASAASLLMGQADEGIPVVLIRDFEAFEILRDTECGISPLIMPKEFDVFRD